jgi:hypothetical protein
MNYFFIIILIFISSCSLFVKKNEFDKINYNQIGGDQDQGYVEHLESLGESFKQNPSVRIVKLNKASKKYLNRLVDKIKINNELLFKRGEKAKFSLVRDKAPFIFSLPGSNVFISTGLINKYLKNENLFVSAVTYELIKSERNLYQRKSVVPKGYVEISHILSLTRVPLDIKMEINKWTYFALKRSGFDSSAILIWIQNQNKNILDFSLQHGNIKELAREEFLFKSFLATQEIIENFNVPDSSSRGFYKLRYYTKKYK